MSKNKNKSKKPAAAVNAPVKTVATVQRKCMFEYIAVNILSLFVFLSFGYIALMAFLQTSVLDPEHYTGEHILFQDDMILLNILFTVLIFIALFGLKRFISKNIEDDQKIRKLALIAIITIVAITVLFMLITIAVQILEKDKTDSLGDAIVRALDAPTSSMFFPMNFLLMALLLGLLLALYLGYSYKSKHMMFVLELALAAYVLIIGIVWVLDVQSIPAADSRNVFDAATGAAKGNYNAMQSFSGFYNNKMYDGYSYFDFYPFQLGFVAFSEFVYRIFGTESSMPMQIINVMSLASAYFAVARITRLLFKSRKVELIAVGMLTLCLQPILFCTFVYGNIIGMSCAIWASLFLIKYFQTGSYAWIYPAGGLLVLAVLVKYNNMIYLVAFVIMLVIHIVKMKKWQSAVIAAAMIAVVLISNALVTVHYESRTGVSYASGVSQTLYLDLGLQESSMAPGWYTHTAKDIYTEYYLAPKFKGENADEIKKNPNRYNNKYNSDPSFMGDSDASVGDANKVAKDGVHGVINKQDKDGIFDRLGIFADDPEYAFDFFSKKILSQWNEPTFESIWVSKVKSHTATDEQFEKSGGKNIIDSSQTTGLTKAVYEKSAGQALELHFNMYMQLMYILFAAGIYMLFINRKTNIETVLLPLVLLGAFGYHLLFEGKSQYILTYIPLLVPTAAYALHTILNGKYKRIKKFFTVFNRIPNRPTKFDKPEKEVNLYDDVTMRAD